MLLADLSIFTGSSTILLFRLFCSESRLYSDVHLYKKTNRTLMNLKQIIMKKLINLILITAVLSVSVNTSAYSLNGLLPSKKPDKSFTVSSRSRTVEMKKGQTYHMKMTLRNNRYYFIALQGKRFLGPVQCKIIVPSENNKIIFDNAAYEFDKNITFYSDSDRDVVVEIKTMSGCFENELSKKGNVKLLLANKKLRKNEKFTLDSDYNLYAVN